MYFFQNMFVFFYTSFIFLGSNQLKHLLVQFLRSCLIDLFSLFVILLLFCISMSIFISSMLRFIYGKQISSTSPMGECINLQKLLKSASSLLCISFFNLQLC